MAQGSYVPNMNFIGLQIAELRMYVSVAMVTRFTKQQNNTQSCIGPRNLCTKYELHRPSNSRVMNVSVANLVLAQGTYVPNMSFIGPQIAELDMIHDQ